MAQSCERDTAYTTNLTIEDLEEYFPDWRPAATGPRFNDTRHKHGVYIFDDGHLRHVHIRGQCPNQENGRCRLGEQCFGNRISVEITSSPKVEPL